MNHTGQGHTTMKKLIAIFGLMALAACGGGDDAAGEGEATDVNSTTTVVPGTDTVSTPTVVPAADTVTTTTTTTVDTTQGQAQTGTATATTDTAAH
jgi:hypothetical protein